MIRICTLFLFKLIVANAVTWVANDGTWDSTRPTETISAIVNVLKMDAFGAEPPHVDISFKDSTDTRLQVYLPGTSGNSGRFVPMTLQDSLQVTFTGYRETNATAATAIKTEMLDAGLLAGRAVEYGSSIDATVALDKRPIFVVTNLTYNIPPDRRLAGTAALQMTAIVVLFQPCGVQLSSTTTIDRLQNSFFSLNQGSYYSTFKECTRNLATLTGVVKGPINGCPKSRDNFDIYDSIAAAMKDDPDWKNNQYKLMVLPTSWLNSIGSGTVGGSLTWYQEKYITSPQMFLHELGHNQRLHHASLAYKKDEYKDISSAMGYCCTTVCYNFIHSWQLGIAEFSQELKVQDLLNSASSAWVNLPALSSNITSGAKITGFTTNGSPSFVALSYRSTGGFDRYLSGTSSANRVQISHWTGRSRSDAVLTYLLDQAVGGQTIAIMDTDENSQRIDTGLKLTVNSAVGDSALVFVCKKNGDLSPCPASSGFVPTPSPAPAPAPPPSFSSWSSYFSDQAGSIAASMNTSLWGVGCQGMFCANVRVQYRTDIKISPFRMTTAQLDADIGSLLCNAGQVASSIFCLGSNCSTFRLLCSSPTNGQLAGKPQDLSWFPQLHQTGDSMCNASGAIVGIRCSSANCATKMLVCDTFVPATTSQCIPRCGQFQLECGDDGCGGSCGTCLSRYGQPGACSVKVGRCLYTFETTSATSGTAMLSTNLVSTGMGCSGGYCARVKLIQASINVDASFSQNSMWISDNTWKKYFLQSNSGDTTGAECTPGMAVTLLECKGDMCENIRFKCGKPYHWIIDQTADAVVTDWFSDEGSGKMNCPDGMVVTGLECQKLKFFCLKDCGNHCDYKRLHCRSILPQRIGNANLGVLDSSTLDSVIPFIEKTGAWWQAQVSKAKLEIVWPVLMLTLTMKVLL